MRPAPPPTRRRASLVAAILATVTGLVPVAAAAARPAEPAAARDAAATAPNAVALAAPSPDLPGLPPVSPDLASIPVDSRALRRARAVYDDAADVLAADQARRVEIDRTVADTDAQLRRSQAERVAASASADSARARLRAVDEAIADLAISIYTTGGPTARVDAALATAQPSINDADRRDVLASASMDVLLAERAAYQARLDEALDRIDTAAAAATELGDVRASLTAEHPAASDAELASAGPVATERVAYEEARVLAQVEGVEFPLVALDAYYRAARSSATDDPRCGVRWWAIAGISRVEGHHGSYGGAALDKLGDTTKRIIGIPLDGTNQTQVVTDSDDGALDGDPVYDRAVGPMQFIPQTWLRFAADGNDDGVENPFNLYDATLAAARYLCRASRGLEDDPGLRAAYFSYNHSDAYVERVLSFARLYERSVEVPAPPLDHP